MTLSPTTCRICLQTDSRTTNIFSTYSPPDGSATAASAISRYAFVQVLQDDGLPQGICNVCQNELHRTLLFIKLCEKSDKKLRTNCQPQDKFSDVDEPPAPAQLVQIKEIPPILTVCSQVEETKPEQTVIIKEEYNPAEEEGVQNEEFEKEFYNDISKAMENKEEHLNFVDVKDIQEDVDMSSDEGMLEEQNFEEEGHASDDSSMEVCKSGKGDLLECTPSELYEIAESTSSNLLPSKSRDRYEKNYKIFSKWKLSKQAKHTTENVILAYLVERNKTVNSATLWSEFSMLKSVIKLKEGIDIDLFHKAKAYLKKNSTNYQPKKSKMLDNSQCLKFLRDAPDEDFLMSKVALIMGIYGACRTVELLELSIENIEIMNDCLIVSIPNTKNNVRRSFVITNKIDEELKIMNIVLKYYNLRPPNTPHKRLFIKYSNGNCTKQPVGKNTLGKVPYNIAKWLHLPNANLYTGHCFRRSSGTLMANSGANLITIKKHGGWRSSTVAENYIDESLENKKKCIIYI